MTTHTPEGETHSFDLEYCKICAQMTNHIEGVCQKHDSLCCEHCLGWDSAHGNFCKNLRCNCHELSNVIPCRCRQVNAQCMFHNPPFPIPPSAERTGDTGRVQLVTKPNQLTFIQKSDAQFDKKFTALATWNNGSRRSIKDSAEPDAIKSFIHAEFGRLLEEVGKRMGIGFLRQWLNEDRNCEPMVSNEDLEKWLLPGLEDIKNEII